MLIFPLDWSTLWLGISIIHPSLPRTNESYALLSFAPDHTHHDSLISAKYENESGTTHPPISEYILWTDRSSRDFIQEHYPWFLDTFDGHKYPIQRTYAIRYFILFHFGGIYVNVDVGCLRRFDSCSNIRSYFQRPPLPVIHRMLPNEIMTMIFEEHAKLEWKAPAIVGRVCVRWRQIVLSAPRAWAYLEICHRKPPSVSSLLLWLDRSRSTPLHIRVDKDFIIDQNNPERSLYDLLRDYHKQIACLRMWVGRRSFFEDRDFPCMRHLHVRKWYSFLPPARWGAMPELRSLHLGPTEDVLSWNDPRPRKTLVLTSNRCTSLSWNTPSLVTLMLHCVSLHDPILGPLDFPLLTHLALICVSGLKPYINAPNLVTYHEGECTMSESFLAPLPSLVEYGCIFDTRYPGPPEWHCSFPNIERVAVWGCAYALLLFPRSLSDPLPSLSWLRMISAEPAGSTRVWDRKLSEEDRETVKSFIRMCSKACQRDITLRFEFGNPLNISDSFSFVSYCHIG